MANLVCDYYNHNPKMSGLVVERNALESPSSSSSSSGKISPAILFIIIIIAVIFFVSGVLHILVRLLTRRRQTASPATNPAGEEEPISERQLQQLFHLHDSGLDQSFIDALPRFLYGEIDSSEVNRHHFDCAVCLCEFSAADELRLLPPCSHAFHVDCIDTWLLSNSTCPLCRASLSFDNPVFFFGEEEESLTGREEEEDESQIRKRVMSVRLGKFRSVEQGGEKSTGNDNDNKSSSSNLGVDSRRCYSMGSYQYVEADSDLQVVALRPPTKKQEGVSGNGNGNGNSDSEGKRIMNVRNKGESFSVSKIWQWPRKEKCPPMPSSSQEQEEPRLRSFPWNNRSQVP